MEIGVGIGVGMCGLLLVGIVASAAHSAGRSGDDLEGPFLTSPFADSTEFEVTETWLYSDEERAIHGFATHSGVDLAAARNTPVYAPAGGYALASFHLGFAGVEDGSFTWHAREARLHQGKFVGFGLGNFVQIYVSERNQYLMLGHLQCVAPAIPFHQPRQIGDGWNPNVINEAVGDTLTRTPTLARRVEQGDLIGYVGDTGCSLGYLERPGEPRPDPDAHPSWDETHVHLEVYTRGPDGGKSERFDPLGFFLRNPFLDPGEQ
ncbi:MAG: hypothetical protein U1C18_01065 [Patescibacteria group bacterium]|nr:hypothetical protein [Patescibacteria group bacterium]